MTDVTSLEPLADYLEPRFGNIYEYGLSATDGSEVQSWTEELKQAIATFLLDDGPKGIVKQTFYRYDCESDDHWLSDIFASYEPWEVAFALRLAIVRSTSTLDQLIGDFQAWPSESDRFDAEVWLEEHASESQLQRMAAIAARVYRVRQNYFSGNLDDELPKVLEPHELLSVWHDTTDSAPSDLTDAEWGLIKPFVPGNMSVRNNARSAINGMLYWFEVGGSLSRTPARYGTWQAVYQRRRNYKQKGVFDRMLQALQGNPEAARLVAWLRQYAK
jgi:transposase